MRVHLTNSWIFQGWITYMIFASSIQRSIDKPPCGQREYVKDNRCCSRCEPGTYLYATCLHKKDTICRPCGSNEYQPEWTKETKCHTQKYCDEGKGFMPILHNNSTALIVCQCKEGYQCSLINCEYCEEVPSCPAGQGLHSGDVGRSSCRPCPSGYFSDSNSGEACKKWTDCRAVGRAEERPGSREADVVCGPPLIVPSSSWAVVSVTLSVIIVISLIVLFLFCYKDKLSLLSVNLRSCVQNLKRTRIQQETLTTPYNSSSGHHGDSTHRLICQDDHPPEARRMCLDAKVTIPDDPCDGMSRSQELEQAKRPSGPPSEASEDGPPSPLSASSCSCALSMKEPVEVGENEDCSQLLAPGLPGPCSCRGAEPLAGGGEPEAEVAQSEALLCGHCLPENLADHAELQGSQELYLDYSSHAPKDEDLSEARAVRGDASQGLCGREEPSGCSVDSTTVIGASSVSANDLGLSLFHSKDVKLSDPDSDPEYQSQCCEAALSSGQVTGNNNTTFISNGQVMNFSGDVIVVYVSQTSRGCGTGSDEEPFICPVQEESSEDGFQCVSKTRTDMSAPENVDGSHQTALEVSKDGPLLK